MSKSFNENVATGEDSELLGEQGKDIAPNVVDAKYAEGILAFVRDTTEQYQDAPIQSTELRQSSVPNVAEGAERQTRELVFPKLEDDPTLAFFDRMNNPRIREQMVDLECENEKNEQQMMLRRNQILRPKWLNKLLSFFEPKPKSREKVSRLLDKRVRDITQLGGKKNVAYLNPQRGHSEGSHFDVELDEVIIDRTQKLPQINTDSPRTLANILAHEKGHQIRSYETPYFNQRLRGLIDFNALSVSPQEFESWKSTMKSEDARQFFTPGMANGLLRDYLDAPEIIERMSQLKNYFGFHGDEKFTKAHLDYAREHYVADVGMDNEMTPLLRAVTSEKEEAFIDGMNSLGV